MKRILAATLAALLALLPLSTAAAESTPAAEPFPIVPLPAPPSRPYGMAWLALGAGAGLLAGSFVMHERANRSYRDYLDSTEPADLDRLYDRTLTLDRTSGAMLIAGEVMLAAGIYLRFLRTPRPARLTLAIEPARLAARWSF